LWGIRLLTTFLHDGRATTIAQAIAAYDGQGRIVRDRVFALGAAKRDALLAFVRLL
jgi:CxxC motif-containing protein (DUF1111 family)